MRLEDVEEGPLTWEDTQAAEVLWRRLDEAASFALIGERLRTREWAKKRESADRLNEKPYLAALRALGRWANLRGSWLAKEMRQEVSWVVRGSLLRVNPELALKETEEEEARYKAYWRRIRERERQQFESEAALRLKRDQVPNGGREPVHPRVFPDDEPEELQALNGHGKA